MENLSKQLSQALKEWSEVFMHRSMKDFGEFIRQHELSVTQLNTLMRLYYKGSCGISEIGCALGVTNAATSQMAQKLVEQNLVARTEDPADRRHKQLALTDKGKHLIEQGIEIRRKWMEDLTANLSKDEVSAIITALSYLTQAARQGETNNGDKETKR